MNRSFPLVFRFLIFIALPIAIVAVWLFVHLRGSLPQQSGEVRVAGIGSTVSVVRDAQGVPVIKGNSEHDVFFAMGYVQAQDRLWQLEVQRRIVHGKLSEIFGRDTIRQDAWMRTLGIYDAAKRDWPAISVEGRDSLTAYSDGVNAWIAGHSDLPVEFVANGVKPEPWTPLDSLAWIKLFALNLSGNMSSEISHYVASQVLGKEKMTSIFGDDVVASLKVSSVRGTDDLQTLASLLNDQHELEHSLKIGGRYVGSNAWVVSGKLTESGNAMLANDPHLGLQIPSLWYPVVQQGGRLSSSGMSLVGLPVVIFGRNRDIAWGGTSMTADVEDLYFEEVNPAHPTQYNVNGHWEEFSVRDETIGVKADFPAFLSRAFEPVAIKVRSTRHGPVVSDIVGGLDQPVALRWTALVAGDTTYDSFFHLNYASDWASFRDALRSHVAPTLNMLYADRLGNIGYIGVGKIPIRSKGGGAIPVDGTTDEYNWAGFIPFDSLPQVFNPENGYIVSANNKPVGSDYPYFISSEWAPPGRAQRIEQLIQQHIERGEKFTTSSFGVMQADVVSLPAQKLARTLATMHPTGPRQEKALAYIRAWHGEMRRDDQAPAIFNAWMRHLRTELFLPSLKADWNEGQKKDALDSIVSSVDLDALDGALSDGKNVWCDQGNAQSQQSCNDKLSHSLDLALNELEKLRGSNMDAWRWGEVHKTVYEHAPFSHSKLLSMLFEKSIPNGGSTDTIDVANASYRESDGYRQTFGAGFRQIMQFGKDGGSVSYMNSTGQSGNVLSQHYADMVEPFRDVRYYTLPEAGGSITKEPAFVLAPNK
jgi:penicillin amidase